MKKSICSFLFFAISALILSGCASPASNEAASPEVPAVTVRLGGLKGPTSMGMVKLLDDAENGKTDNEYSFTMAASADELVPLLLKGELDILAVPINLGSILYANTDGGVQLLAASTRGVLYIVEKGGNSIGCVEDLRGRTIYATGKGTVPEYTLTYLLAQHGLDISADVTVEWKSEPTEIAAQMASEESAVAMLPQPFVAAAQAQVEGLCIALDLTQEWDSLGNDRQLITAGLLARREFVAENPEAVSVFLREYADSCNYVNQNTADAARLIEKYGIVKSAVAEKAIPYCGICCITGEEMKTAVSGYLDALCALSPASVGGAVPKDEFYFAYE